MAATRSRSMTRCGRAGSGQSEEMQILPHAESGDQDASGWCRALLESWSIEPERTKAMAVLDELLANAIKYGNCPVQVEVQRRGERIRVGVRDGGSGPMPAEGLFPPLDGTHGLGRVAQASYAWGVNRHCGHGATVWSELETGNDERED
jgi:anti-sigma regulatory factor (Ser/Thr protein kinase)